jgi:hypothetical protein
VENIDYDFFKKAYQNPTPKVRASLQGHFGISVTAPAVQPLQPASEGQAAQNNKNPKTETAEKTEVLHPKVMPAVQAIVRRCYKVNNFFIFFMPPSAQCLLR